MSNESKTLHALAALLNMAKDSQEKPTDNGDDEETLSTTREGDDSSLLIDTTHPEVEEGDKATKDRNKTIFEIATQATQNNWSGVLVDTSRKVIKFSGASDVGYFNILIDVKEEERLVMVYVLCPLKVPQEKRYRVAEFLTLANYGIKVGNFEMDCSDGDTRYKGCIDLAEDGVLTESMLNAVVGKCAATMSRYFPGIAKIIYSDVCATQAIELVEPSQATAGIIEALAEALNVQVVQAETESDEPATQPVIQEITEEETEEQA